MVPRADLFLVLCRNDDVSAHEPLESKYKNWHSPTHENGDWNGFLDSMYLQPDPVPALSKNLVRKWRENGTRCFDPIVRTFDHGMSRFGHQHMAPTSYRATIKWRKVGMYQRAWKVGFEAVRAWGRVLATTEKLSSSNQLSDLCFLTPPRKF